MPVTAAGRGCLIALEGGEGCGKTTQAARLAERLGALLTREPGGTPVGARLRELFLDPEVTDLAARAEALLVAADRAQHVAEVIRPALEAGRHVVTDRFLGSSLAYQGYGRGLDLADVRRLSEWATEGLAPDLVVLLDLAPGLAASRRTRPPDRLESEDAGFHRSVEEGYRELAAADPDHWEVVDAAGEPDQVEARIAAVVAARLGDRLGGDPQPSPGGGP